MSIVTPSAQNVIIVTYVPISHGDGNGDDDGGVYFT